MKMVRESASSKGWLAAYKAAEYNTQKKLVTHISFDHNRQERGIKEFTSEKVNNLDIQPKRKINDKII